MMDGSALPQPGDTIAGKYVLERVIGEGGMSVVYGATHRVTGKRFAIKWMLPDVTPTVGETARRFIREAQVAGLFQHPNVVEVYDVGQVSGSFYMVMEWLDGESLAARLERVGTVPFADVCAYLIPCMHGVTEAHSAGIVHRDLKPANIFLCRAMHHTPEKPKVLDFGIAKISKATFDVNSLVTKSGVLIGTPHYLSPEQLRGQPVDHRTDVYAFGVIMYQLLSGKLPFPADNFGQLVLQIATGTPVPLPGAAPGLPHGAAEVVAKAMAREPDERFQSLRELVHALEAVAAGLPLTAAHAQPSSWPGPAVALERPRATPHSGLTYPSVPVKTPPPLPSARAKANGALAAAAGPRAKGNAEFKDEASGPSRDRAGFAYEHAFDATERTPSGRTPFDSRMPSNGLVPLDRDARGAAPGASGGASTPGRTPSGSWRTSHAPPLSASEAGVRLISSGEHPPLWKYAVAAVVLVSIVATGVWWMKSSARTAEASARTAAGASVASRAPLQPKAAAAPTEAAPKTAQQSAARTSSETSTAALTSTPAARAPVNTPAEASASAPSGAADPRLVAPSIAELPATPVEAEASKSKLGQPSAAESVQAAPAPVVQKPKPKSAKPVVPPPAPQPPIDLQPTVELPADPPPAPTSSDTLDRNPLHMKLQ